MRFFQRLGLGLVTSLFSALLVVGAVSISTYMVLDKPQTVKTALADSGTYRVLVDNTLEQKRLQLSKYLPVDNAEVRSAVQQAFSTNYLQQTTERNIDTTYDWIHGKITQPHYSANLAEPKNALANSISGLVQQKVANLPVCTDNAVAPTTVADVLALDCRPKGIPTDYLVSAAHAGVEQSSLFEQVVSPVLTLQDAQGKSLTSSLGVVPKAYHYFILSLYIVPIILLLAGVAILFWSESKRQGLKIIARGLIVTGIITLLLSWGAVWGLGKVARLAADSSSDLLLVEGKIVEVAHLIAAQLRNWLFGIGGAYIMSGIVLLIVSRFAGKKNAKQNIALNKSLGYNDVPAAGTTFGPGAIDDDSDVKKTENTK